MLKDMYDSTDSSSLSSSDDSVSDSEALSSFPLASSSLELASPLSSYENKNWKYDGIITTLGQFENWQQATKFPYSPFSFFFLSFHLLLYLLRIGESPVLAFVIGVLS